MRAFKILPPAGEVSTRRGDGGGRSRGSRTSPSVRFADTSPARGRIRRRSSSERRADDGPVGQQSGAFQAAGGERHGDGSRGVHRDQAAVAAKIRDLRFSASQNDRAAPARKQARLACGGDGSGGAGDVKDGATCAHHAVANIGELGRKAIDAPLKALMKITDEQSSADSAKVKCLRTSVGWCVRPRCARDAPELCPGYARDVPETVEQPAPEMWRVRRPREVHPIAPRRSRALVVVGFRRRPAR